MKLSDKEMQNSFENAWHLIPANWPLNTIIARNPLSGLEDLPFEDAILNATRIFKNNSLNDLLEDVNFQTIKWCQAFFDEGQSLINMPNKDLGLFEAWIDLAKIDYKKLIKASNLELDLPKEALLKESLSNLGLNKADTKEFFQIALSSLPGWAGYIKYLAKYKNKEELLLDFLLIRVILINMMVPDIKYSEEYLNYIKGQDEIKFDNKFLIEISEKEKNYQKSLAEKIKNSLNNIETKPKKPDAEFVFCIDVRSEGIRKSIEKLGNYKTYGYAGFFGLPISISEKENEIAACPVLLKPSHKVILDSDSNNFSDKIHRMQKNTINIVKDFYKSLKYNFTTAFSLAEISGFIFGSASFLRTFYSNILSNVSKKYIIEPTTYPTNLECDHAPSIAFDERVKYAKSALEMIGMTKNFAPIIIFCGHKSQTSNNPYESALDCGACGGNKGGNNAKILASILNQKDVRKALSEENISIPEDTFFLGGEHNTTNDEIEIFDHHLPKNLERSMLAIKQDLMMARKDNNAVRAESLFENTLEKSNPYKYISKKCSSWSETRPEWGLAKNVSFIVGPRDITKTIDLESRSFLHSYNYKIDENSQALTTILTAPMIVAQWINSQYFFSTMDNVTYGAGSKITHNITGRIGIVQGNASDLMYGLPMQSVYNKDDEKYHEPLRLSVFIHAPKDKIEEIVMQNEMVEKLCKNEWVFLFSICPEDKKLYKLSSDIKWENFG